MIRIRTWKQLDQARIDRKLLCIPERPNKPLPAFAVLTMEPKVIQAMLERGLYEFEPVKK